MKISPPPGRTHCPGWFMTILDCAVITVSLCLSSIFPPHLTSLLITGSQWSAVCANGPSPRKDYHTREVSDSDYCELSAGAYRAGPRSRRWGLAVLEERVEERTGGRWREVLRVPSAAQLSCHSWPTSRALTWATSTTSTTTNTIASTSFTSFNCSSSISEQDLRYN